jgi:hypothetical protein
MTARWLHRLRKSNVSQTGLFDLLFAQTYGPPAGELSRFRAETVPEWKRGA